MVHAVKVVTHAKDYSSSQPNPGKEPNPLGTPLRIEKPADKPEAAPHIPKGVLKRSGPNPNSRATQNYSVVCIGSASELSIAKEGFSFRSWCEW